MSKKVTIALLPDKDCKHTRRFKSTTDTDAEGHPVAVESVYLARSFVGNAKAARITIEID